MDADCRYSRLARMVISFAAYDIEPGNRRDVYIRRFRCILRLSSMLLTLNRSVRSEVVHIMLDIRDGVTTKLFVSTRMRPRLVELHVFLDSDIRRVRRLCRS